MNDALQNKLTFIVQESWPNERVWAVAWIYSLFKPDYDVL